MNEYAIEARDLRKAYGDTKALQGVTLNIRRGEVFCLLGPNGAGKTTAIEIMEGHRTADSGDVRVLGSDPALGSPDLRRRVGIVLQQAGVERFLKVEEVIELFSGYYPSPRPLDEVLAMVGLQEKRSSLVRRLSVGQVRRLDVAIALSGDPDLLFLDEPTTGFDPEARRDAWEMIRGLRDIGKTVVLTTHYLEEAEHLADRAAVLVHGAIRADGTIRELRERRRGTVVSFRVPANDWAMPTGVSSRARTSNGRIEIDTTEPTRCLFELTRAASENGVELQELTVRPVSLEDVYLELVGPEGAV